LALDAGDPGGGGVAVDQLVLLQRAAAERMALVAKHDSRTAMRGAARGGKARRPAADDEHAAVRVLLLIAIGVGLRGGAAQSGGATDEMLVFEPPRRRRRPHERLVVKARGQKSRQRVRDRAQVEAHRRPAVLARRN